MLLAGTVLMEPAVAGYFLRSNRLRVTRISAGKLRNILDNHLKNAKPYRGYVGTDVINVHALHTAILSGNIVVKSCCCAVGCTNCFKKGSGDTFYRFPEDEQGRLRWIAAGRQERPDTLSPVIS